MKRVYKWISLEIENEDQLETPEPFQNLKIESKLGQSVNPETPKSQFVNEHMELSSGKKRGTIESSIQTQISPKHSSSQFTEYRKLKKVECRDAEKIYFFYPLQIDILASFWKNSSKISL